METFCNEMKLLTIRKDAYIPLLGALLFGMFGLFLGPWMTWSHTRSKEMQTWPKTGATVVSAHTKWAWHRYEGITYQHAISYRYSIGGTTYTGDRVSYGGRPSEWPSECKARTALPALGSSISISYNPTEPEDSVIRVFVTSDSEVTTLLWICGYMSLVGAGLMIAGFLEMKKTRRPNYRFHAPLKPASHEP